MSFLSARLKVGMTQKDVAKSVGVDQSAVCFWENGKTRPRASTLVKLSGLYNCTIDELLRDVDDDSKAEKNAPPGAGGT